MDQHRRRRINPLTVCAAIVFGFGLLTSNIYPQIDWGTENLHLPEYYEYEHGWPMSYMSRELYADVPYTNNALYGPWPLGDWAPIFRGNHGLPPLIEFRPSWLAFDAIASIALLMFSVGAVHSLFAQRDIRLQFTIRHCLALMALISLGLVAMKATGAAPSTFISLPFRISLHIVPQLSVMLALAVTGAQIIRMIRRHFARRGFPDRRPR